MIFFKKKLHLQYNKKYFFLLLTFFIFVFSDSLKGETVENIISSKPIPVYKDGHTLPRLTTWTANDIPTVYQKVLAEKWNYAVMAGRLDEWRLKTWEDSKSEMRQLIAWAFDKNIPVAVIMAPNFYEKIKYFKEYDDIVFFQNDRNLPLNTDKDISPEAPINKLRGPIDHQADFLKRFCNYVSPKYILYGREWGLKEWGKIRTKLEGDTQVISSRMNTDMWSYLSSKKRDHEKPFVDRIREIVPQATLISYGICGERDRERYPTWQYWVFSYRTLKDLSDFPSISSYYMEGNSGWISAKYPDQLTQLLTSRHIEMLEGKKFGYPFFCAGWKDGQISDSAHYVGFLKMAYMTGLTGGVSAYFGKDSLENWIWQLFTHAHVQAFFSYFEEFIRDGILLEGVGQHPYLSGTPSYNFCTSNDSRVFVRKSSNGLYLIVAWQPVGSNKKIMVSIPELGNINVNAKPEGSTYIATIRNGKLEMWLIDQDDPVHPSIGLADKLLAILQYPINRLSAPENLKHDLPVFLD